MGVGFYVGGGGGGGCGGGGGGGGGLFEVRLHSKQKCTICLSKKQENAQHNLCIQMHNLCILPNYVALLLPEWIKIVPHQFENTVRGNCTIVYNNLKG